MPLQWVVMCWQTVDPLPTTLAVAAVCFVDGYSSVAHGLLLAILAAVVVLLAFFLLLAAVVAAEGISLLLHSSSILPIGPVPIVSVFLSLVQSPLLCVSSPPQGV